jgi:hypothetical protein
MPEPLLPQWLALEVFFVLLLAIAIYLHKKGLGEPFDCIRVMARKDSTARIIGALQVLMAVLLGYVCAYWTYWQATQHVEKIHYIEEAIVAPLLLGIMGMAFLVFGSRVQRIVPMDYNWRSYSRAQWVFIGFMIVVTIVTINGYPKLLERLGYTRTRF